MSSPAFPTTRRGSFAFVSKITPNSDFANGDEQKVFSRRKHWALDPPFSKERNAQPEVRLERDEID